MSDLEIKTIPAHEQSSQLADQIFEPHDHAACVSQTVAAAEARQLQIENEKERQALASAEKDRDYLVQENAQLAAAHPRECARLRILAKRSGHGRPERAGAGREELLGQ